MTKILLYHEYDTAEAYALHLRKGGLIHDAVVVEGVLYTMDEYDMDGRIVTYGNVKHGRMITIETENRYARDVNCMADAVVTLDELTSTRIGFRYIE